MLMLALGDSITYGYGATAPEHSYAKRLQKEFAKNVRTSLHVQAKPGWTAKQLRKSLPDVPQCIFDEAQIVTLMIGGNDLLRGAATLLTGRSDKTALVCDQAREDMEAIILHANRPYNTFAISTLYNPFPNFDLAERITSQFNDMIRTIAKRHRLILVESPKLFRGNEPDYVEHYRSGLFRDMRLFRNPIHPTDAGHEALFQGFYRALQQARSMKQKKRIQKQSRRA